MAEIELVVKLPEEEYKIIKNYTAPMTWAEHLIKNGTLLPKGHGRLIDADALPLDDIDSANYGSNYILIAPTIIEADREV